MCSRSPRRFIFQVQRVHQGLEKVCSLIGATRKVAWNGEGSSSKTIKKRKEGGGGERKKTLQEGREKGQSLVNRPSKHPQGSMANQILTHTAWHGRRGEGGRSNDKVEEEEEVEVRLPDLSLCSREVARQCADRKQTSGNDRGRQCAFKTRQTVICHVFHAL